jgi:hypothetical protein
MQKIHMKQSVSSSVPECVLLYSAFSFSRSAASLVQLKVMLPFADGASVV